ncbi:PAS domain S-box protein [Fredinandcohnia quinoae]|uniref:histidine kinase n=1 Tax=Fredinandcohnia quinoae TaxID=2918902 RepID=A0AAW5DVB1_9BACI|nr:PAS domain S-box protein [Fredinandcohnia sp. SECRCQ15]MCH1623968.1 PAS domain S-box protein [Fredinandcohnia sp. SECRCQ15]
MKNNVNLPNELTECVKASVHLAISVTTNGKILYISNNCEEILGYKKDELIYTSLKRIIHQDDTFLLESYFFSSPTEIPCTFRMKTSGNEYIWFETILEPIGHSSGKYEEVLLKLHMLYEPSMKKKQDKKVDDGSLQTLITHHQFSEQLRGQSSILLEEAPFPIIITKLGQIVYMNTGAVNLLAVTSRTDFIGSSIYHFIEDEFHEVVAKRTQQLQLGHSVGIIEQKWKKADGNIIDVEVKAVPAVFDNEKFEYIVLHDISSRKAFHDIIHRSRERYQRIVQNSIDTIAVIYQNNWVFINDSGVNMFDANSYTEMLGKNIYTFLHPENHEQVRQFIDIVNKEKKEVNFSKQSWYTLQGSQVFTELIGIPTTYFGENAVQVIIRDISDRVKAENLMIQSEKLSIAGQLAAGIAHEIRNPLTAIKGFLQLFNIDFEAKKQYFDIIFSELNRIELILSELLLLAKPTDIKFREVDVKTILINVVTLLDTQAILKNIQINLELEPVDSLITCDGNQIKQVFINLIKNSIDAMSDGGNIYIKTKVSNGKILISFTDEGCGIPEHVMRRIGEPFFTTKEKGTGLGLMVSYNIIENHNGQIKVESIEDKGTTFEICLPLVLK